MIAILKQQLRSAVERQQRWNALRDGMRGANYETWKRIYELNEAEIDHLSRLLVSLAESHLQSAFVPRPE